MGIKLMQLLVLIGIMATLPLSALAREKPNLALTLSAEKEMLVKDNEGVTRTEWREIKSFNPGDVLRYTIAYTNTGSIEARDAVIVDPVPVGTMYISGSAEGKNADITFSLDGKIFQSPPLLKYRMKSPATSEQEFSATPEMYTHIRWKIVKALRPGGAGTVSFKVKVK